MGEEGRGDEGQPAEDAKPDKVELVFPRIRRRRLHSVFPRQRIDDHQQWVPFGSIPQPALRGGWGLALGSFFPKRSRSHTLAAVLRPFPAGAWPFAPQEGEASRVAARSTAAIRWERKSVISFSSGSQDVASSAWPARHREARRNRGKERR